MIKQRVNSKKVRENAYASLVTPTLEYSRVLRLGSHTKSQVHKLENVGEGYSQILLGFS
jgi:hypothetical protein